MNGQSLLVEEFDRDKVSSLQLKVVEDLRRPPKNELERPCTCTICESEQRFKVRYREIHVPGIVEHYGICIECSIKHTEALIKKGV